MIRKSKKEGMKSDLIILVSEKYNFSLCKLVFLKMSWVSSMTRKDQ